MPIETYWYRVNAFGLYNQWCSAVKMHKEPKQRYVVMYGEGAWATWYSCVVDDFGTIVPVDKFGCPV